MAKRRDLWHAIAVRNGLAPGSFEEKGFIEKNFGIGPATFDSNLSRGFARRHIPALRKVCERHKLPFNPNDWCPPRQRDWNSDPSERIAWAGKPLTGVEQFYEQLNTLYGSASEYRVLRVGGVFSRNRTNFRYDEKTGLAIEPEGPSIRMPYLRTFWDRVLVGDLSGISVHVVKTLDRLTELWACVEYVQKNGLQGLNQIYLAPVPSSKTRTEIPAVGMRIVDYDKTLFSLPAPLHGESHYSSWIESERVAKFASEYITRVRDIGEELTKQTPVALKMIMKGAFASLKATKSGNYGILDSFENVETIKARMVAWADGKLWLPVIG